MRNQRIPEDGITMSAAMGACEKGKQWERALALLVEMKELRMQGNIVAFTAALTALGHEWQRALLLLEEMRQEEISPNDVTYTTLISACGRAIRWEVSLWLLSEMENENENGQHGQHGQDDQDGFENEIGQTGSSEAGVLALSLTVSAIERGSTSPGPSASLLHDLTAKAVARSKELREERATGGARDTVPVLSKVHVKSLTDNPIWLFKPFSRPFSNNTVVHFSSLFVGPSSV
eukprot:Skav229254  [mRNA]  locus=scaffold2418:31082:31783:- [translate_table: standard]